MSTRIATQLLAAMALVLTLASTQSVVSAAIINGGFESGVAYGGVPNNFVPGTPAPWVPTAFTADCYDNSGVDGFGLAGIPVYNNMFQGMLASSGNRFLGFAAGNSQGIFFNESFSQTTVPLVGGQTYTISADLAVDDLGKASGFGGPYTGRGPVDVYLDSNFIGSLTPNTVSLTWEPRSFTFVAPNVSTAVFTFVAGLEPITMHSSYIGIDNIRLVVPEPGSMMLGVAALASIAMYSRRRIGVVAS